MNKLNLKTKLVLLFLITGLLPLAAVGIYSYTKTSSALKDSAYGKLEAVRTIKGSAIKRYFGSIRDQILTFSEDKMIVESMDTFKRHFKNFRSENNISKTDLKKMAVHVKGFYTNDFSNEYKSQNGVLPNVNGYLNQLDPDSIAFQYHYISNNSNPLGSKHLLTSAEDNSNYSKEHKKVHSVIANFLDKFGYYDIFLVDSETGDIVYSVFKELDYSTSLIDGPYANTNFGEAFRKANALNDPSQFVIVDYKQYPPSYEAPASFIASPIFKDGKKIGVAMFQMPIDRINSIMGERAGMGKSGETFLVGPDNLVRSDVFHSEDHSVVNSFRNSQKGTVLSEASKAGLKGESGHILDVNYEGKEVLSSFAPIDILGLKWTILSEIHKEEAFSQINELKNWMLVAGGVIAGLVLFIGLYMGRKIALPILKIAGELDTQSVGVRSVSDDISKSSQDLALSTTKQSSAIEETVSSMEEMAAMLQQTSSNADDGLRISEEGQKELERGREVISKMVSAMDEIQDSNNRLESIVKAINEIKQKTQVINDIVSETRLLSFNASIEAARAGVHGKGFAVVAEEVGNLATMSGKAAEEIRHLLDSSTAEVEEIVSGTKVKVEDGKTTSQECQTAFEVMSDSLNKIVNSIQMINSASKEQESGVKQTNTAMNEMETITQKNSISSDDLAQKASDLEVGAGHLASYIEELKFIILGSSTEEIPEGVRSQLGSTKPENSDKSKSGANNVVDLDFSTSDDSAPVDKNSRWG